MRRRFIPGFAEMLTGECGPPLLAVLAWTERCEVGTAPGVSLGSLGPSRQWRVVIGGMGARQLET